MATNSLTRRALIDQIPNEEDRTAPPAQPQQGVHASELGRQAYNTVMALPGAGGLAKVASTGGLISRAINQGAAMTNAAARTTAGFAAVPAAAAAQGQQAGDARTAPSTPAGASAAATPAASPGAASNATTTAAGAEASPSAARRLGKGIYAHGYGQYSDNEQGMGFGAGGGVSTVPSAQNQAAANALADYSQAQSQARVATQSQAPQISRPRMPSAAPSSAQSERERRALISSLTTVLPGAKGITAAQRNGLISLLNNESSAAQDMQRTQAGLEQAWMREQGENQRSFQRNQIDSARLGLDAQTQGFAIRSAAQQERLRNTLLDESATPEQRSVAQRSLAALAGKSAADRLQTVALPDTVNEMGQVVRGGQALVRLMEDGTVQQVPVNAAVNQRQVPQAAIEDLRRNPQAAAQFDEIFGQGASKQYLR